VAVGTAIVERIGSRRGLPFGRYHYTDALRPQIGGVPAIVPLAWLAMALPARETVHAALGARSGALSRTVAGAAALTAWYLFLDPQMVGEGYWVWRRRGVYQGIPLSNFAGWFVTSIGAMAVLEVLLPPTAQASNADTHLIVEYAFMGVMETIGFARYFRDPIVATVGGLAMLPVAVAALVGKARA
jgi:putative membrane protein